MGTYKGVKAIAICIVMPLILATAQHGEWSIWSECFDIGSYHNNDVVQTSQRSRSCRESDENKPVNSTDCNELYFEIRTCEKCQNCSQGFTPTTNQQEISLTVNTEELEEYYKMSADGKHHGPHQANHSRQLRAADLFPFLSSPGHRGKSKSSQTAANSQDFLQLLNLAGKKKIEKKEDKHLNSFWDLVEKIPKDDSNKDDLEKHLDNMKDLLHIAGTTLAKEEQTAPPTIVLPQLTTLSLTKTAKSTGTTSKSNIGYELPTSHQPVETTESTTTTEAHTPSTSPTPSPSSLHLETEVASSAEMTAVPTLPTSFPVISTTSKSTATMRGTTTEEVTNTRESWSTTTPLETGTSQTPEERSKEAEYIELTTQIKRPHTASTEKRPGFLRTTLREYFERTKSENVPAKTTISPGEFTTYAVTEEVSTQERKLTSTTRTTSRELFPVETTTPPKTPQVNVLIENLSTSRERKLASTTRMTSRELFPVETTTPPKTPQVNVLIENLSTSRERKLASTTRMTSRELFPVETTTPPKTPQVNVLIENLSTSRERKLASTTRMTSRELFPVETTTPPKTPQMNVLIENLSTSRERKLASTTRMTSRELFPVETTTPPKTPQVDVLIENLSTSREQKLASTTRMKSRELFPVETQSTPRLETQSGVIPEPDDFLKLLEDTIKESVNKHEKVNPKDLENLGNLIKEAEETVDNNRLSEHLDDLNKLVKLGETTTFTPTTEEHFTERPTTHEVLTVTVEPERTPPTSVIHNEQTTTENIPAKTTMGIGEFTTLAVTTEEVATAKREITSTTTTTTTPPNTPQVNVLKENLSTSRERKLASTTRMTSRELFPVETTTPPKSPQVNVLIENLSTSRERKLASTTRMTSRELFPVETTTPPKTPQVDVLNENLSTSRERKLASTTRTTSRELFPVETQSTPRLETQSEVIPEPDDFLKLLEDTIKESVNKHDKVNPNDLENLGNLIKEAEETVDNNRLSEHLDDLNKLVKLGETITFTPTTEEHFTERPTTHEVLTVTVEPERTPPTSVIYNEQTTTENIPAKTTMGIGEFTTLAVTTEEVATAKREITSTTTTTTTPPKTPQVNVLIENLSTSRERKLASTTRTTSRELIPVETQSTPRLETQSEVIPEPDDFLKLLEDTIKESVNKHEKVNPKDLENLGNLLKEAEETVDNNQLSKHLDTLNELVNLGETTTLLPTTEGATQARREQELMTTLLPESQTAFKTYAPTTFPKLQTAEVVIWQTNAPTYSEEPPTQAMETTAKVQHDFLELLVETLRDVDRAHHTPNPKDLQDIQDLIEVAQQTMDNEKLSENLNQLSQILNPVELPVTTEKTIAQTAIFGEDLLNLIDKAGMGNEEPYLDNILDEIGNFSESKVSGKDLDLINELLKLGGKKHTTSLPQTEASTSKPTMGGQYLLEFLNQTEIINPEDIQDEFKDELNILNQFLFAHKVKPGEEVEEIINKIGGLLRKATTTPPTTTLYTSTHPVLSTTKEGAALLGMFQQLEETEKIHKEENHRQVQNLEDLFQDVGEADNDIFSHELNHLNQFLNPTPKSMETTVPLTTVTRDKVLEFVGEIAGHQEEEPQRSKEDIANINQIFEGLQESDKDVLDNEVQQLIGLLAPPAEVTPTPLLTTVAYKTTAKMTGEEIIDFIDEFKETKSKTGEKNKVQVQNFEQLFKEAKEQNKDILSHEINHLNQFLNPSTMSMATTPSLHIPTQNVLDFVNSFVKLTLNETLKSRAEVDNLEDLFKGLNESDEAVLSHEVYQLLGLLMPVAPPTTTLSGQYLLELFNETELVNQGKILEEWGKDITLVDSILKKTPLNSNEDLLDHIGNLIKEKSTPFPVTTKALASEAPAKTKEQHLLDLMETLSKTKFNVSENNLIEIQGLEDIFKTAMDEDKDKLMEDLAHLEALLRPQHITTQPLTSKLVVTLPTTKAYGKNLLDLINGVRETHKDKLEGEQGIQDIQDVLMKVPEPDEKEMLAAEVEHLSELFLPVGASTAQPTSVPTTTSVPTMQPTIEGKYILDLLLQVEKVNGSKLIEDLRNDKNLVNQFVETGGIKFKDDLQEAIGQIGMLLSKKTTEAPVFPTTITIETPSTTDETDNKLILDLIDTLGKEKLQKIPGVQDIKDVLVKVHEPDEEDMLAAEVKHFSELFLPAGASTSQPTTVPTTAFVPTMHPTIGGKYLLDLLLKVGQVNRSELVDDLRNDEHLVNQFVEAGKIKFGYDLQEAIDQIGMLLSKKTTETPVIPTTELLQQPSVTITVKTPSTTAEADNELILDLIDTLGNQKLQEMQGEQDIHDIIGEVQEVDAEGVLAEEVKHIADILVPPGASIPWTTAVPGTFAETVSQSELSSTTITPYPTIGGIYILDFLQKVEKVNWTDLIDDFNHDKALLNQFVETGTIRFEDDLKQAIGQIGVLLAKAKTSEVPVVTERAAPTPSTRPDNELFLDLIDTLGKTKAKEGGENNLEIQKLETIFDKEKKPTDEILDVELDRLNQLWGSEEALVSPLLETTMSSSTSVNGEKLLDLFDEVAEVAKDQQRVDKESLGIVNDIFKGAFNESDRSFLKYEVNRLLDLLQPEEARTSTLSPTEEVTTHLEGFAVTSVTQQSKHNQEALFDLLSGNSVFENMLRDDTAEVQNTAELFDNMNRTDKDFLVNEIAKLKYNLQFGGLVVPTLASSQQTIPSTQQIIKATSSSTEGMSATTAIPPRPPYCVSTLPTETSSPVSPSFKTQADEETFLENLRYLVGRINTDLPWDDMRRVGALSEELDKDAKKKMEEELGFVKDIMHDVGEMEKSTPETSHVMITTLMQMVTATTHALPATKMMTPATKAVLGKETTEGLVTTPETSKETTVELVVTPKIPIETTVRLETTSKISTPSPTTSYSTGDRWTEWSSWGDCSSTCGPAEQSRRRDCQLFMQGVSIPSTFCEGSPAETIACEMKECPAPSPTTPISTRDRWTEWSSWGDCSSTCGQGEHSRRRECQLFIQGVSIPSTFCEGSPAETMACEMKECPAPSPTTPISTGDRWTEWSSWGDCSSTCGPGEHSRRRECQLFIQGLAIPSTLCEGSPAETIACEMKECPAPSPTTPISTRDRWTEWSSWGDCSSTCGPGEHSRRRECQLFIQGVSIPSTFCEGSPAETIACEMKECPAPSPTTPISTGDRWTEWSSWGDCSSTCGPGEHSRRRECQLFIQGLAIPSTLCEGSPAETIACEMKECPEPSPTTQHSPVDRWTEWSSWGDCSSPCGPAEQSRRRECRLFIDGLAIPSTNCEGSPMETIACDMKECPAPSPTTPHSPVDRWTEWSSWGDCSSTCGPAEQSRRRECRLFIEGLAIPSTLCEGSPMETIACDMKECPAPSPTTPHSPDDRWTEWSSWGDCSSPCGPAEQSRRRECRLFIDGLAIPSTNCEGSPMETIACDMKECPARPPTTPHSPVDRWTEWSSWGNCSSTCGPAEQSRRRACRLFIEGLAIPSTNCEGSPMETIACDMKECPAPSPTAPHSPVDRWTEWSSWGDCSSTCGPAEQSRRRECRLFIEGLVIPSTNCEGSRAETMACELMRCPEIPRVDGQWSYWSAWTDCSAMCGPGNQTRYRLCDNPGPSGGGLPCEGAMTDSQDCLGDTKICVTGMEEPFLIRTTPKPHIVRPSRKPVDKTVAVAVLASFISVVVVVLVSCIVFKTRKSYGKKEYRSDRPMFYR